MNNEDRNGSNSTSTPSTGQQHLRRTSAGVHAFNAEAFLNIVTSDSVSSVSGSSYFGTTTTSESKVGQIALPISPPLRSWHARTTSNADEKRDRPPPYSRPVLHSRRNRISLTRVPKSWMSVITLAGMALLVTVIELSYRSTSSTSARTALGRFIFSSSDSCDLYSAPGSLVTDFSDPDKNEWIPSDKACVGKRFMQHLREDSMSWDRHQEAMDQPDFTWLHNRTALIIGDSISREHVESFCNLMGVEVEVIRASHRYSPGPAPIREVAQESHSLDKPVRLTARGNSKIVRDSSLPRMCYIPKYDFLIASVFHYGLDQEDYWRDAGMPQYVSPGSIEHRISDVIIPLIEKFRSDGRRSAPDFVEVSSGTWDLARWANLDREVSKNTETGLTSDRIGWYRFRVGQLLEAIRAAFPDAKAKTWRTLHFPLDQRAEQDYFMDKIITRSRAGQSEASIPLFSHNRIHQLDQSVRSLLLPSISSQDPKVQIPAPHADYRINEWGTILKGWEAHQTDRLHGQALPGSYIWADIFLYELWRGVTLR